MKNKRTYQIMAQRFVVNTLECNRPYFDDEGLSPEDEEQIMNEYNKILNRLEKVAIKNGGNFNRFSAL